MRNPRWVVLACLFVSLMTSAAWAQSDTPHRYIAPALDMGLVQIQNPVDGRAWSIWSYRCGGEFDIAVSLRQEDGRWSEPSFFGRANSRSEMQPAVAVDGDGNLYLAFAVRESGKIMLTVLRPGSESWSVPVSVVQEPGRHVAPAVRVIGGSVVVAYRTGSGVGISVVPAVRPGAQGIQDGPDTPPGQSTDGGLER